MVIVLANSYGRVTKVVCGCSYTAALMGKKNSGVYRVYIS